MMFGLEILMLVPAKIITSILLFLELLSAGKYIIQTKDLINQKK